MTAVVLTRYDNRNEPTTMVEISDGTWIDDPDASEFLADGIHRPTWISERLSAIRSRTGYEKWLVAQPIDPVAEVTGIETDSVDDTDDVETVEDVTYRVLDQKLLEAWRSVGGQTRTNNLSSVSAAALFCLAAGVLASEPGVLLASNAGVRIRRVHGASTPTTRTERRDRASGYITLSRCLHLFTPVLPSSSSKHTPRTLAWWTETTNFRVLFSWPASRREKPNTGFLRSSYSSTLNSRSHL